MKGFDIYEHWRSGLYRKTGFVAPSWDALEIWERAAWEEFALTLGEIAKKNYPR